MAEIEFAPQDRVFARIGGRMLRGTIEQRSPVGGWIVRLDMPYLGRSRLLVGEERLVHTSETE